MNRIAFSIALLIVNSAPVWAFDLPAINPGLWQSATAVDGAAPVMTTMCIDGSVQKEMFAISQAMMQSMCSTYELRQEGNRYLSDSSARSDKPPCARTG